MDALRINSAFPESDRRSPVGVEPTAVAIRCEGVTKDFGQGETRVQVLQGINVEVPYGEMTLLVGPSGCGKTTLISIIAGLLDATQGRVTVLGSEISAFSGGKKTKFRLANVGFVFQQYNLLPALTAAENAAVPLIIAGINRREAVDRAGEMLEKVGLGNKRKSLPSQLSGGQQQRVAIARALVHGPRLLVCDEPTAALDAKSGQTVMQLLRESACRPDRAVIVVTHDNRIYHFGDRIISMSDGRVESVHTGEQVKHFTHGGE
ncbi:ABC transporter ATP-binding protein [Tuwongella immobilis]|uniref:ABC transporter domain-containing protein n=1 Tax=Tuwongella immobilis TaxID=692036 RepID=A0A6C2YKE0_9BACT|nr:ABC transporter ATP-binding protein [Tuwongella immobilis]VIP01575.1 abc transporter atp-binding protein : Phosphonate-transporting ATPase OS=Planctomyces brasiliensis (strain ATCC 49424 / DSM 5305 / JCM 21570 / NBRC 103401 / IFAM 1448) GN=Plabr_3617 PE=3 SV=1: ABC_tran [Tuwongella immobilis]VTR98815.1 abc transporter atp-binding protein : Phosphonate-transporting ATPase OS=Planctomyces brasiliensis (strain ATCC 49424 / DSM 5305 / JCM 21570 / NBRC 103401 / IFAM 1448) GN=Plabr_3617 PE=3 SV=1: A